MRHFKAAAHIQAARYRRGTQSRPEKTVREKEHAPVHVRNLDRQAEKVDEKRVYPIGGDWESAGE